MTIELLRKNIGDVGVANAIIYLDSKIQTDAGSVEISSIGRVTRQAPSYHPDTLKDLAEKFSLGWAALGETPGIDLEMLESLVPSIGTLVSGELQEKGESHMLHFPHLGVVYGALNQEGLAAIESHDAIEEIHHATAELEHISPPAAGETVSKTTGEIPWGLQKVGAPELWAEKLTGKGILIAHLDTGADSSHPVLKGSISSSVVIDKDGKEAAPPNPFADSDKPNGHGTHTASVLVARHLNGEPIVGMAPGAELACAVVAPKRKGDDLVARFLGGMEWSLTTEARIVNMSIGVARIDKSFEKAISKMRKKHMLPIAATGNGGPNKTYAPGNYETVLSVGAISVCAGDEDCSMAPFSGKATAPSVSAPGMKVYSAALKNEFSNELGTSIAAPHVAGLAALLFEAKPLASIDQVQKAIIASCCNPKQTVDSAWMGAGIPNGKKALDYLKEHTQ